MAASSTMHFGSNNFEFEGLFVQVGTLFCKEKEKSLNKNLKKMYMLIIYVNPNLVLSHFWWLGEGSRVKNQSCSE